jgi:hypothetical protein
MQEVRELWAPPPSIYSYQQCPECADEERWREIARGRIVARLKVAHITSSHFSIGSNSGLWPPLTQRRLEDVDSLFSQDEEEMRL